MHHGIHIAQLSLIADAGSTGLASLGLHQDNAVGTVGTRDSGRSVLQNGDALHLVHVEVVEFLFTLIAVLIDEIIDDVKRSGVDVTAGSGAVHISRGNQGHGVTGSTDGNGGILTGATRRRHRHV